MESLPRGPRKPRRSGPCPPRLSNHKRRAAWFQARTTWPVREAKVEKLVRERARAQRTLAAAPGTARWQSIGPTNIGCRATAAVCDPSDPRRIFLGAAGGGVWRSLDGGLTWRSLWHRQRSLNVGALAIDPRDSNVVYCGTGEANLSADSYPGVGVYKTLNGGASWRLVARSSAAGAPSRIGTIAIDPFDSRHLVLGGVGYSADEPGGLYVSWDAGAMWSRLVFVSPNNYWVHAVVFHPEREGTIYVTVTENGARNGIWRTTDGGSAWTQLTRGLPPPGSMDRTALAISPSNPRVLYAQAADDRDLVLGIFKTTDGGDTWRDVTAGHFGREGQMLYGNAIVVHPTQPNHVLCGGVDLHRTTDGGSTWTRLTRWDAVRGTARYAHADHHALLMPATSPGLVYDANDGGLDVSLDGGDTWANRSGGLGCTMYYDVDVAQTDGRMFGGGAQDNGTLATATGRADDHVEILGGDGGWMVIDPRQARHQYASWQHMGVFRVRPHEDEFTEVPLPVPEDEAAGTWMTFITFDPANTRRVFLGSSRVWRTLNDGGSWRAVSPHLDGSSITAIEVATADPRRVYVGTENGGVFRSRDGGETWSSNLAGATLPGFTVTRLETSPVDADLVLATIANTGHSHVFRSDDGGLSWRDIDGRRLPDVGHHAIVIRPNHPQTIYVSNDAGVYVSPDLGTTWMRLTRNLPNVMVVDLVYHEADRTLTAATYGRSLWRIAV
jgi:photosystem II stability/assembly factor-like uncharacterized protein